MNTQSSQFHVCNEMRRDQYATNLEGVELRHLLVRKSEQRLHIHVNQPESEHQERSSSM